MRTIAQLARAVQHEAERADFPIDREAYERHGKDPTEPVLFAGNLDAPVAILGRDLGKDEVAVGQPLVGAGGRLVRVGIYEWKHGEPPPRSDRKIESALDLALLANTVPYKPPGNKAYPERIKARFRPFVAELLVDHWTGDRLLTLGTEAFQWFAPYADPDEMAELWARGNRYESAELDCELTVEIGGKTRKKKVRVGPLPHPSPLNQRWFGVFPALILQRLRAVRS